MVDEFRDFFLQRPWQVSAWCGRTRLGGGGGSGASWADLVHDIKSFAEDIGVGAGDVFYIYVERGDNMATVLPRVVWFIGSRIDFKGSREVM